MTIQENQRHFPAGSQRDTIIEVRDASVTFDMDRGISKVLNNVNIDIHRGEILGIVGESGSGKSMFASALLDAVVEPGHLSGDVFFYGDGAGSEPINVPQLSEDQLKRLRWEEISMVFQGAMGSFNPTLSIRTHFKETIEDHDYDIDEGMERARRLLSDLYLEPDRVLDSYPHELSGGMKQRALIALSLVLEPEVLVMDEPTAALDLLMQRSIISLLHDLKEKYNLTLIFITHDLPLVADSADRLAVMYAFEFIEIAPSEEIIQNAAHPYTRALLKSVPNLDAPLTKMQEIEGSSPDPVNVPTGCSYHPRCPLADDQCRQSIPPYHDVDSEHQTACFYWDEAAETLPLSLETAGIESETHTEHPKRTGQGESVVSMQDLEINFENQDSLFSLFSEPETVHAVDGVSLDVHENEVVALVGESGCGKTTLGKAAVGLQRPTNGSVAFRGQDIWDARKSHNNTKISYEEIRQSLQIIHQDPGSALNPNKTVLHTLQAPLKRWQPELSVQDQRARILGMLERVSMTPADDYARRYPHQLSGGEKQRVALIRALLMNPDLILADEAISALDVSLRIGMMDLMLKLQEEFNTAFLFISHDLSNARYFTSKTNGRIGVMYLGKIVEIGRPEDIINNPQHPYTQVLVWGTPDLDPDVKQAEEPPLRKIDIPDATNPPSGCRFHTRCPEARSICQEQTPELIPSDADNPTYETACFRADDTHEYWDSRSIVDEEDITD